MLYPTRFARQMLAIMAVLGVVGLLLGAARIARQQQRRDVLAAQIAGRVSEWHLQLACELPEEQRAEWLALSANQPVAMLRACTIETMLPPAARMQLH